MRKSRKMRFSMSLERFGEMRRAYKIVIASAGFEVTRH
jgi:hypothetical protein